MESCAAHWPDPQIQRQAEDGAEGGAGHSIPHLQQLSSVFVRIPEKGYQV